MNRKLRAAFLMRERAEMFLTNLEKLKAGKSVSEAEYGVLKAEYTSMREQAVFRVNDIKADVKRELGTKTSEAEILRLKLNRLEARFKVGQISKKVYTRQAGSPQKKLSGLELQIAELRALISARGSADIRLVPSARVFGFDIGRLAGKKTEVVAPATAAVPEKEPLPSTSSDLAFSNLQILPDRVTQGSSVGVIATITNDGWGEVQRKIEFKVNGKMQAFENVALAPGESQEVTFVTIGQEPGDYEVEVGDLAGRFKVLPAASAVR